MERIFGLLKKMNRNNIKNKFLNKEKSVFALPPFSSTDEIKENKNRKDGGGGFFCFERIAIGFEN